MAIFGRAKDKKPIREPDDVGPGRQKRLGDYPQQGAPIRKVDNDIPREEPWMDQPDEWPKPVWTMKGTAKRTWRKGWKQDYDELKGDLDRAREKIEEPIRHPYAFSKGVAKKAALAGQIRYEQHRAGEPERRRRRLEDQYAKSLGKPQTVVVNRYDPVRQAGRQVEREVYSFLNPAPSSLSAAVSSSDILSFYDPIRRSQSQRVQSTGRAFARADARSSNKVIVNINGKRVRVDPQEQQQSQIRHPESIWGNFNGPDLNVFSNRQQPSMPAQQAARLNRAARKYPAPGDNGGLRVGHLRII